MSRLGKILFLISGLSVVGFLAARFILEGFVPALWAPLGLFLGSFLAAIFVDRQMYFEFMTMKTTKHGMNMGVMILSVVVMLAAVNFVSIRHYKTFDFSLAQQNTLSDQSIRLLKSLDSELKILFFYKDGADEAQQNRKAFQSLVKRYQDNSAKVSLDFVEVNKRPDLAEQYNVNKGGGVVFVEYKGKRNRIEKIEEQEITGAIAKATRDKDKNVYLVTGHAEGGLEDTRDPNGLAQLKGLLEGNRYLLKPLPLATKPEIPKDADVVLIIGAKQSFLEVELGAIEKYLQEGGNLFVALDPSTDHGLKPLLEKVGVKLSDNYIINVMQTAFGKVADPSATPGTEFSSSNNITKVFGKNEFVLFRMPQGLEKVNPPSGVTIDDIVKAGENSFGYPDNKFEGQGTSGPFTLVASVKGKWPSGSKDFQLVVAGDSDFLNNQMLYRNLNRDLMLNSILTLAKEENMVSITPKEIAATELTLTENKFYMFLFAFVIPLPILMLVSSGLLWYRRRNA
jgi:ABC-type uncharacterized transport system involved in gliding motility auxiliary subunit